MNYELAQKLKEAGFPIKEKVLMSHRMENELHTLSEWFPTLSELIEACGDDISHMKKIGKIWWAVTHSKFDENGNNFEECSENLEEAVANLWLSLNRVAPPDKERDE